MMSMYICDIASSNREILIHACGFSQFDSIVRNAGHARKFNTRNE